MAEKMSRRLDRLVNLYKTLEARDLQRLEALNRNQRAAAERRQHALEGLSSADPVLLGACALLRASADRSDRDIARLRDEIQAATKIVAKRRSQLNRFERRRIEAKKARNKSTTGS